MTRYVGNKAWELGAEGGTDDEKGGGVELGGSDGDTGKVLVLSPEATDWDVVCGFDLAKLGSSVGAEGNFSNAERAEGACSPLRSMTLSSSARFI